MKKPIFFLVVFSLFIVSLVSGYLYLKETKRPTTSGLSAIPVNAFMVFETQNFLSAWKNQSFNSQIFEALRAFKAFTKVDSILVEIDSLTAKNQNIANYLAQSNSYLSLIKSGAKKYDFLFSVITPNQTQTEVDAFINHYLNKKGYTKTQKTYENAQIISYTLQKQSLHYCLYQNTLFISKNLLLIEEAVRHINHGNSLLNKPSFVRVYQTTGKGNNGHVYINSSEISDAILSLQQKTSTGKNQVNIGNWCALDLFLKTNEVFLSGFFQVKDSTQSFLNRFKNQKSYKAEISQILPASTAYLFAVATNNFTAYMQQLKAEYALDGTDYNSNLKNISQNFKPNFLNQFIENITNEMGVFITEPILGNISNNSFAYFKISNINAQVEAFNSVATIIDSVENSNGFSKIHKLNTPAFLHHLFGKPFSLVEHNYFVTINNFLVFGNSNTELKDLVRFYNRQKTLQKDLNFRAFSENLSSDFNSMIYLNIARCPNLIEHFIECETAFDIKNNLAFFRQFEGLAIQFSNSGNQLYYTNIFFNHNPVYTQETGALWVYDLDTISTLKPFIFENHYTKAKEIFTQDLSNNLYLLSNTGKLIWQKLINEPITGDIFMVDAFNNGKWQIAFNTATKVYLIDRNGENVSPFPISFNDSINSSISVVDYDNNNNYRVLIPLKNGELKNYDFNGKPVEGWQYVKQKPISQKVVFFKIGRNDYLLTITNNGQLNFLNRKGEQRLQLKTKIPNPTGNIFLEVGKSVKNTIIYQIDSTGNLFTVSLDDQTQNISGQHQLKSFGFTGFNSPENNKVLLVQTTNKGILLTENNLNNLFLAPVDCSQNTTPQVFILPNKEFVIAVSNHSKNKIYLINRFGQLYEDYPFTGSTPIVITDINNDEKANLVVSSSDNKIFVYALQ